MTPPTTLIEEPPTPVASPYLTLAEAAAYCRRTPKTLCNHKAAGKLRAVPSTRPPLFRVEDLDAWIGGSNRRWRAPRPGL